MHEGTHHDDKVKTRALLSSVAWSLVLHTVVIALWVSLPEHEREKAPKRPTTAGGATVKIKRSKHNAPKPPAEPPEQENRPFAKTDADRPQQHPLKPDFEGQRDAKA